MDKQSLDVPMAPSRCPKRKMVTIFAGGVLGTTSDETIINYFKQFCPIYRLRRVFNKESLVAGYAFFEVDKDNVNLIVQNTHMMGQGLVNCKVAAENNKMRQAQQSEMDRKLFVSNLPPNTTEMELLALFKTYGPVTKAYLVRNRTDGSCKNFGFVIFEDVNDLNKVLKASEEIKYKKRRVNIQKAVDRVTINNTTGAPDSSIQCDGNNPSSDISSKKAALAVSQQISNIPTDYRFNISFKTVLGRLDLGRFMNVNVKPDSLIATNFNSDVTIEW